MRLKRIDTKILKSDDFVFSIEDNRPILEYWDRKNEEVTPLIKGGDPKEKVEDIVYNFMGELIYDYIRNLADDEAVLFHIEKAKMEEIYEL